MTVLLRCVGFARRALAHRCAFAGICPDRPQSAGHIGHKTECIPGGTSRGTRIIFDNLSLSSPRMLARLATAICLAILGAASAYAHPAPGIVCSPEGDIYFVVVPRSEVLVFPASHKHLAIALQPASARDLRVPHHLVLRDGHLYTASDAGSRVWRMRIGTGVLERIYP